VRRSKNGWLRYTEDGAHLQDPDVVEHELRILVLRTGSRYVDATFAMAIASALDPDELERQRLRRHVFLARWGRQPVTQWENMDGRLVRQYVAVLAELLQEENAAAKRQIEQYEKTSDGR
jgi:hypothetical protein